ncbi:hypothetical protein BV394_05955 [Brevirhabdus pacifica]|uniref:Uncharacterized protein n=1 Tax=Brevirhabdus pacifica TaxID=1267768 RepID=A0A1U7DH64_9RHOB|nr:DUF2065 domain-containing protein [Brevirhabdus pacifica]APX89316.1 hypothetical protein BV394_05955 [Brevirhabdus pacifica]OWU76655.1 hypothetical protein ATO5_10330 [Loktanella sp. 22II-4b]PJJ86063.1 hypothetical protein CLV77_0596 [Brevirhabdus pacifica]
MAETFVTALGIAIFFEGLVFALAPSRMEELVRLIAQMPRETRRLLGISAMLTGLVIVWIGMGA